MRIEKADRNQLFRLHEHKNKYLFWSAFFFLQNLLFYSIRSCVAEHNPFKVALFAVYCICVLCGFQALDWSIFCIFVLLLLRKLYVPL